VYAQAAKRETGRNGSKCLLQVSANHLEQLYYF